MTRNILFDLDGTLFNFDECEKQAMISSFKAYGKHIKQTELEKYKKINSNLWNKFEMGLVSREYVLKNRFVIFF